MSSNKCLQSKNSKGQAEEKENAFFCISVLFPLIKFSPLLLHLIRSTMHLPATSFRNLGLGLLDRNAKRPFGASDYPSNPENVKLFKQTYGVSWKVCEDLWDLLDMYGDWKEVRRPQHLMWTLLFLRKYDTERSNAARVGTTTNTFRKWVWRVIEEISSLAPMIVSHGKVLCSVVSFYRF